MYYTISGYKVGKENYGKVWRHPFRMKTKKDAHKVFNGMIELKEYDRVSLDKCVGGCMVEVDEWNNEAAKEWARVWAYEK